MTGDGTLDLSHPNRHANHYITNTIQGRIQDFKLGGGGALNKIKPSGGRREDCWDISCEKSRFYAKKSFFSNFRGGGAPGSPPPHGSAHAINHYLYMNYIINQFNQEKKNYYKDIIHACDELYHYIF